MGHGDSGDKGGQVWLVSLLLGRDVSVNLCIDKYDYKTTGNRPNTLRMVGHMTINRKSTMAARPCAVEAWCRSTQRHIEHDVMVRAGSTETCGQSQAWPRAHGTARRA